MGIRESLKNLDAQDLNLKDLNLEQEETEEPIFDVEKEAESQFEHFIERLKEFRKNDDWTSYAFFASKMIIIYPDRIQDLDLNQEFYSGITNILGKTPLNDSLLSLRKFSEVKLLFPEYFRSLDIDEILIAINEVLLDTENIFALQDLSTIEAYINRGYYARILFPKSFTGDFYNINEEKKQIIANIIQQESSLLPYLRQASRIKIAFPKFDLKTIGINKKFWERVKRYYGTTKQQLNHRVEILFYCKILAAKEVKITDQGLELIMSKNKFKQEKLQRPERRER